MLKLCKSANNNLYQNFQDSGTENQELEICCKFLLNSLTGDNLCLNTNLLTNMI